MQGWGTILSVPLSTAALIFTAILLRHEMQARRNDREEAEAAQANLVFLHSMETETNGEQITGFHPLILNNSGSAISNVVISITVGETPVYRDIVAYTLDAGKMFSDPIKPMLPILNTDAVASFGEAQLLTNTHIEISFTDSTGRTWMRHRLNPPCRQTSGPIGIRYPPLHRLLAEYLYINRVKAICRGQRDRLRVTLAHRVHRRLPLHVVFPNTRKSESTHFPEWQYQRVRKP